MKYKSILAILFSLGLLFKSFAQQHHPEVGKPMPNFVLVNIKHYKTTKASLNDFKGKWLFLDFWFTGCSNCIKSFPKVNAFYSEFKDQLTWILVGKNDTKYNKGIEILFEKLRVKQNLQIPAAYDSVLTESWEIHSMPHIIIVDPEGIVRFITGGRDITSEKIEDLLDGKEVSFYPKDNDYTEFNAEQTSAIDKVDASDKKIMYYSVLSKWNGERPAGSFEVGDYYTDYKKEGFLQTMIPLFGLYDLAYFGRWFWGSDNALYGKAIREPILELKDTSFFEYDYAKKGAIKGVYNYNLILPSFSDYSKDSIMEIMRQDLKRVFKYDVSIENRKFPTWKFIATAQAIKSLATKGGEKFVTKGSTAAGFTMVNSPGNLLLRLIGYYIDDYKTPFIDESGITGNIDFTIDADMTNVDDVRKALKKQGLDLIKEDQEMKVLVIRDPKN
jgi:thiol-disulfide isomerase/thioredoxin